MKALNLADLASQAGPSADRPLPPPDSTPTSGRHDRGTNSEAVLEKRRRKERHFAWEEAELAISGTYARNLESCRERYPELSPMEHRVCALAKAMLPNWKIAEILGISERTVENHLRATRKKLGLPPGTRMHQVLKC